MVVVSSCREMLEFPQRAQPLPLLLLRKSTLAGLPLTKRRKVGMTSKSSCPYDLGLAHVQMAVRGKQSRGGANPKSSLSSDCGCNPAHTKSELLVIADQHAAVNTFPALYTPPVTPWESVTPSLLV